MKFKTIFIIFNSVIVFSFLFIFFMPLILLGSDYFSFFASKNWIAGLVFLVTLAGINIYFIGNWHLFSLLEQENWPKVIEFLEYRIFERSLLIRNRLGMLVNAYLITSQVDKIKELEHRLQRDKPKWIERYALQLGIPYLLQGPPEEAEKYFGKMLASSRVKNRAWIRWNHAFALMQRKEFPAAKEELLSLLGVKDPVLKLLCLYMLDSYSEGEELRETVRKGREELRSRFTPHTWEKQLQRSRRNMEVVLLSQIVSDATKWLFGVSTPGTAAGPVAGRSAGDTDSGDLGGRLLS